jgi:hypothetical protein
VSKINPYNIRYPIYISWETHLMSVRRNANRLYYERPGISYYVGKMQV